MCNAQPSAILIGQVEVVGVAIGSRASSSRDFTYYPGMPGNSTAQPAEKLHQQGAEVAARHWQNSSVWTCPVWTLTELADSCCISQIDLLKVRLLHLVHVRMMRTNSILATLLLTLHLQLVTVIKMVLRLLRVRKETPPPPPPPLCRQAHGSGQSYPMTEVMQPAWHDCTGGNLLYIYLS